MKSEKVYNQVEQIHTDQEGAQVYDCIDKRMIADECVALSSSVVVVVGIMAGGISDSSSEMIKQTELMCNKKSVGSIKVDTHEDNQAMQRSLIKNGFDYCGVIYLADGSKRVAFEKCL